MSLLLNPPFRAEHVGSFKRPTELLEKHTEFFNKQCSQEDLRKLQDAAIADIVKLQKEIGLQSITDGEFRRYMFYDGVFENMIGTGFKCVENAPHEWFMDYPPDVKIVKTFPPGVIREFFDAIICDSKVKRVKPWFVEDFKYLKSLVTPEEVPHLKITFVSPTWVHFKLGPNAYDKSVYADDDAFLADVAKAYREEIDALYALGLRNIQFDDPKLIGFAMDSVKSGLREVGMDPDKLHESYIKVYNVMLKDKPADLSVGIHLCRGNAKGNFFFTGAYDEIASKLFTELKDINSYYLEYDTERAGSFEPLKHLPKNKVAILGLVSTKVPELEHIKVLKARVYEAAESMANGERTREEALNQLAISPQCGFASHSEGNPVSYEDMKNKLKLVVETAKQIWG